MRISDWSSDVCSSDLVEAGAVGVGVGQQRLVVLERLGHLGGAPVRVTGPQAGVRVGPRSEIRTVSNRCTCVKSVANASGARESVGWGKRVAVRFNLGGRRVLQKKKKIKK